MIATRTPHQMMLEVRPIQPLRVVPVQLEVRSTDTVNEVFKR
jgi:hypothetical protein